MSSPSPESPPNIVGGAVFLSYASQDADAVRRIGEALRAAGIEVWFDQDELVGGDAWDARIRKQIKDCALFVPIISATTQARLEGYFRLEWKLAAQRTHTMAEAKPFLLPVVIDATRDAEAHVPEEFRAVQWTRLPGGAAGVALVARVRSLLGLDQSVARVSRPEMAEPTGQETRATPKVGRRVPAAAWMVALLVLAGAGVFVWRQSKPEPAAAANAGAGTRPPTVEKISTPAISEKSIAVLPFENRSAEKDSAFFSEGVHEEILTNLAQVRELRVVSRTSVMEYRGTTKKIPQIARELGVAYLLEGSVQRAGGKVRVTGKLIRAATDESVWAQTYNDDLTDIFAIQAKLARAIADALEAKLSPQEQTLLARRPTENLAAYDLYLKARQDFQQSTSELGSRFAPILKQHTLLEAAVALDSKFAEAWAALATANAIIYFANVEHTSTRLERAKAAIDRAVLLAPESPEVIRHLGNFYLYCYRDYGRAAEQLEKLARQRPNDSGVMASLADTQQRRGQWQEAVSSFSKATRLDPGNLGYAKSLKNLLQGLRRWDEAIAEQRRIVALQPQNLTEGFRLAYLFFESRGSKREVEAFWETVPVGQENSNRRLWATQSGDFNTAIDFARRKPENPAAPGPFTNISLAMTLFASGDMSGARGLIASRPAILRGRLQAEPDNADLWWGLGLVEAILGKRAEALQAAEKVSDLITKSRDAVAGAQLKNKLVLIHAWAGEKDRAMELTKQMLAEPFGVTTVHLMRHDPWWFPLRGDSRFEALLNDPKNNAPLF
jgi:TolB-like protein